MTKQHSAALILQVVLVASAVAASSPRRRPPLDDHPWRGGPSQEPHGEERLVLEWGQQQQQQQRRQEDDDDPRRLPSGIWVGHGSRCQTSRSRNGSVGAKPRKADWSKLFAAPEPDPVQGRPLAVLSRSFAGAAQGSCYSSPLFLGMSFLLSFFSPIVAAQSLLAWGLGRATYWLSMRGEDVSRRMPAGFVGYASLFLVVGGLAFMNGLKGISALRI